MRLERVDQVVEDRDRPWLATFGRAEREHATHVDDVLADDEAPTQEVDAAPSESGELAPALSLVAHEPHGERMRLRTGLRHRLDHRRLQPGPLRPLDAREGDPTGRIGGD